MTATGEVNKHHGARDVHSCGAFSHGASFPVSLRLTKPIEFQRVFKKPTVSSDDLFKVLVRLNDKGGSRLGMAVSRKVDRRAVNRNRIKRLVRESFRLSFKAAVLNAIEAASNARNVPVGCGLDIVVLPRRLATKTSNQRLIRSLERHWISVCARALNLS